MCICLLEIERKRGRGNDHNQKRKRAIFLYDKANIDSYEFQRVAMTSVVTSECSHASSQMPAAVPAPNITPLASDVASDRQKQRQLLNIDFRNLARESLGVTKSLLRASSTNEGGDNYSRIANSLDALSVAMCNAYKKYPLLCKRGRREDDGGLQPGDAPKKRKKKKKMKNLKKHQIKKGVCRADFIIDKSNAEETRDDCIRALAIGYDRGANRIFYGMSGQYKKIKIHKSIWGKSLLKGRPRGTCAEFKVANQTLNADGKLTDLTLKVVDIMTGIPKPRCRNCLYITRESICLTDTLEFDGDMQKQIR